GADPAPGDECSEDALGDGADEPGVTTVLLEHLGVVAGVADVGDEGLPARLEHAGDLGNGPGPAGGVVDVVDGRAGDGHVEGAALKGQLAHVGGLDLDAVGD